MCTVSNNTGQVFIHLCPDLLKLQLGHTEELCVILTLNVLICTVNTA